jgi:hypothetical protein
LRRLASSLVLATTVITAALLPGAAVFASGRPLVSCAGWDAALLPELVAGSDLIVVAEVRDGGDRQAVLAPEVYLKGPAQAAAIPVRKTDAEPRECPYAELAPGSRVLAFIHEQDGTMGWPDALFVFNLEDGGALNQVSGPNSQNEDELVGEIRDITEQYAVPAQSADEEEGIEWGTTVLPVAVALGIVFVIGLFLMRIWHRIDPS